MVLDSQGATGHNAMLGRKIPHPATTNFLDEILPPAKRLKTVASTDGEDSCDVSGDETFIGTPNSLRDEIPDSEEEEEDGIGDDEPSLPQRLTELESAMLAVKTDEEAIQEYEAMRAAGDIPDELKSRIQQRSWTKGKSSIYVDAFNLALDTVLEDEGHLFDEKEMEVFSQWRSLEYEAQYL
jgi:Fanconi-associated nuclease 1